MGFHIQENHTAILDSCAYDYIYSAERFSSIIRRFLQYYFRIDSFDSCIEEIEKKSANTYFLVLFYTSIVSAALRNLSQRCPNAGYNLRGNSSNFF